MSIPSLTSFAVARNLRTPSKADAGVRTVEATDGAAPPTLTDILAKTVPVGLVSAYSAFIAVVTEVVAKPTAAKPNPDQYLTYRWLAFSALVVLAAVLTFVSYRQKAGAGARFPTVELAAVVVASASWGLGIPESPLLADVGRDGGLILLALIAFVGVGVNAVLANLMRSPST
jgi:hypothetical protein